MGKYLGCNLQFKIGTLAAALDAMGTILACIQRSIDDGTLVDMNKQVTLLFCDMKDYAKQCVEHYVNLAGELKGDVSLRPVDTPFLDEATLKNHHADPYGPNALELFEANASSTENSDVSSQGGSSGREATSSASSRSGRSFGKQQQITQAFPAGKKKKAKPRLNKLSPSEGGGSTTHRSQCAHESSVHGTLCPRRASQSCMLACPPGHSMDRGL